MQTSNQSEAKADGDIQSEGYILYPGGNNYFWIEPVEVWLCRGQHGSGLCAFIVFLIKEKLNHIIPYFLCNTYCP